MNVHPTPPPPVVLDAWTAAVDDAAVNVAQVALIWRQGVPPQGDNQATTWRPNTVVEHVGGEEMTEMRDWANYELSRGLPLVMIYIDRPIEALAGLLRHELEHVVQLAAFPELTDLHERADEELRIRLGTGKSYNAIPMEDDANRAAARFLRRRFGADRVRELVAAGVAETACMRPTEAPQCLETLVERMRGFILAVMDDADFLVQLELSEPDLL